MSSSPEEAMRWVNGLNNLLRQQALEAKNVWQQNLFLLLLLFESASLKLPCLQAILNSRVGPAAAPSAAATGGGGLSPRLAMKNDPTVTR